jgi:5-methylthioadenosine/S-adenosylhomocysteine deaminase
MKLWLLAILVTAGVMSVDLLSQPAPQRFALLGHVITPQGNQSNAVVEISGGTIAGVGTAATGLNVDGVIVPGLIDLHNHYTWNVLPRWTPKVRYANRYEWQEEPEYALRLAGPHGAMMEAGFGCDMIRYAEIKALVNGATSGAGGAAGDSTCVAGLMRNLDVLSDLPGGGTFNNERLKYEIFPFAINSEREAAIRAVNPKSTNSSPRAIVMHVAEGVDAASRREFTMLQAHRFILPGVTIAHGLAFTAPQLAELSQKEVGLVWSPRSNIELYGRTHDPQALNASAVAIAPDWSPTGSSGMIEEIATAWKINKARGSFTDRQMFEMVTKNPARLAGLQDQIGSIVVNYMADLVVLNHKGRPYLQSLLRSNAGDIRLVMVGGTPRVGDPALMRTLLPQAALQQIRVCGEDKLLNLDPPINFQALSDRLRTALKSLGSDLAPLAECDP